LGDENFEKFVNIAKNGRVGSKKMHKGYFLKKWPKFARFQTKQFKISMSNIGFHR
jgi:hypothetical protein